MQWIRKVPYSLLMIALIGMLGGCASTAPAPTLNPVVENTPYTGTAYDVSKVDEPPIPIRRIAPKYPGDLRKAGINGAAVIEFVVNLDGATTEIVARKADDSSFARAAIAALSQWQFLPAKKDGQPVACRMQVPIVFTVNNK